jgi:Rrf2 family protein
VTFIYDQKGRRSEESVLRFSKKADYGLMAIQYIAFHQHDGAVNAKRIAEDLGIPGELLAKILQRLAKQKLIASSNGPKGGYVLARAPGTVKVGEILRAIEGPLGIVQCFQSLRCPQLHRCSIRKPAGVIQASIEQLLDRMTLEEMNSLSEPAAAPVQIASLRN